MMAGSIRTTLWLFDLWITLPVRPSANPPRLDSIETAGQPRTSSGALRVLIADDYEAVRVGLCAILRSADISVCAQAKNGEEAVEKSIQLRPDLIILDISMPGIGGLEAARQIRIFLPDVPILAQMQMQMCSGQGGATSRRARRTGTGYGSNSQRI